VSFPIAGLSEELRDLGQALGLLDGSGGFDPGWLNDPLSELESILSNADQREAFLRFLDVVVPPAAISGLPAGEKWHPLLGNQPNGNLYLTVQARGHPFKLACARRSLSSRQALHSRSRGEVPPVRWSSTFASI
jgi:hypothetical protein